jgi:hypothetical protein
MQKKKKRYRNLWQNGGRSLDALAQPIALLAAGDVHVLVANRPAVRFLKHPQENKP